MEEMNVNTNEVVEVVEEVTENGSRNALAVLGVTGLVIAGVAALTYLGLKKIKARKKEIEVIDINYEDEEACEADFEEGNTTK